MSMYCLSRRTELFKWTPTLFGICSKNICSSYKLKTNMFSSEVYKYGHRLFSRSTTLFNVGNTQPKPTETPATPASPIPGLENWKPVYRFNHILFARGIQRIKVYQTGITCGFLLPLALVSHYVFEATDATSVHFMFGVSTLACLMLGIMGTMASRLIGIIYVHKEDPTQLRVARLSFFGTRRDEYLPSDTFLPIADCKQAFSDAYVVLEFTDGHETPVPYPLLEGIIPHNKYYLSLKYGTILDIDTFTEIFGDIMR